MKLLLFLYLNIIILSIFNFYYFRISFENGLPIIFCSIVVSSFVFAILNLLKYYICCYLLFLLLSIFLVILYIFKKRNIRDLLKYVFNSSFIIFTSLFFFLAYSNYGILCSSWDEFSHWGDVVKAMFIYDDISTNKLLGSAFQSYPPAMSLFQYFLEKLYSLIEGDKVFVEWLLFFGYQLFYHSFLFPILSKIKYKYFFVISEILITYYFVNIFNVIYIDHFLSVLTASGLVYCALSDEHYDNTIYFICVILVLSKDVGLYLAIMIVVSYIVVLAKRDTVGSFKKITSVILSAVLPKLLWNYSIIANNAKVSFNEPIIISDAINIIAGNDATYRQEVYYSYLKALFSESSYVVPVFRFKISYFYLFVFIFAVIIAFSILSKNKNILFVNIIAILGSIIYIYFMSFMYVFKFSKYESEILSCMDRYLLIVLLMLVIMIIALVFINTYNKKIMTAIYILLIVLDLYIFSFCRFSNVYNRKFVEQSIKVRNNYFEITDKALRIIEKGSKVCFISQEDNGLHYWIMHFNLRPLEVSTIKCWSIGLPFYKGDIWTEYISKNEFKNELINNYDYLLILQINDYFKEKYGDLFDDYNCINENSIYKVVKENGLLEYCE